MEKKKKKKKNLLTDSIMLICGHEIKSSQYFLCLEIGVMMTPKRRLSTLIFACLYFKKSFLIKNNITVIYLKPKTIPVALWFV